MKIRIFLKCARLTTNFAETWRVNGINIRNKSRSFQFFVLLDLSKNSSWQKSSEENNYLQNFPIVTSRKVPPWCDLRFNIAYIVRKHDRIINNMMDNKPTIVEIKQLRRGRLLRIRVFLKGNIQITIFD